MKPRECKAWAHWLLSVRNIILIFSYSSLLAWWSLLIRQDLLWLRRRGSRAHWTMEPFMALIIKQTTTKKLKCKLFSTNSVWNKHNFVKLKLENPFIYTLKWKHWVMFSITKSSMVQHEYTERERRATVDKSLIRVWKLFSFSGKDNRSHSSLPQFSKLGHVDYMYSDFTHKIKCPMFPFC